MSMILGYLRHDQSWKRVLLPEYVSTLKTLPFEFFPIHVR